MPLVFVRLTLEKLLSAVDGLMACGDAVGSPSNSIGVAVDESDITDKADSLFSSSGGRLSGWLSLSYLCVDDREKDGLEGDDCLVGERRDELFRRSRASLRRGRSLLNLLSGDGLRGSFVGDEGWRRCCLSRSGREAFFLDLLKMLSGIAA